MRGCVAFLFTVACVVQPHLASAQGLTGALVGTVKDAQGGALPSALVRVRSSALIGGPRTQTADDRGKFRFYVLPPGLYVLDVELQGFAATRDTDIRIAAGSTLERTVVLHVAGAESVVVEGGGSRIDARSPGFGTSYGPEDWQGTPMRRSSSYDLMRAAPGVSATSPTSGTSTTVSAFGSGVNENQFLFDDTNFTCPCNGVARAEPGIDFIQEMHVQSVGASAEFGNVQGAVINVITRQGSNRFLHDAAYYGQWAGLTSQPVLIPANTSNGRTDTGYVRERYRDLTTSLGGPVRRDRLWFFTGYQYLRDYDSQPGTDPAYPRTYEQNKVFEKLTWRLAPNWQLMQNLHYERWVNPDRPTITVPYEATTRPQATVPAITFGHLTHTLSANTLWDVRVGRFVYSQENPPSTGDRSTPSHRDLITGVIGGAPQQFGDFTLARTNVKAALSHYAPGLWGADHQWKLGVQVERGEHRASTIIPTGVRYIDNAGANYQAEWRDPSREGGMFLTSGAFLTDAITVGDRVTINAGVRFDHSRAISQDLRAIDAEGHETDGIIPGLGTLYTWNIVSPRLGVTAKLTADGRTILRSSWGRFSQGVLTGELSAFHPGVAPTTTRQFDPATGGYTTFISTVSSANLVLDRETRAPRTDEFSIGIDREIGRQLALAVAYVRKDGANFIAWTDIGGQYRESVRVIDPWRTIPVFELVNSTGDRRFLLTNPEGYSMTYNGLVMAVDKRRSNGWQAFGSYTLSRASGLQATSGATVSTPQLSTIAPFSGFGRDPNDLTNARGPLPNDRPHMLRLTSSVDVPRTGFVVAANLQHVVGKPWAATAQVGLPQGNRRILLERPGARRVSSQTMLDLRVSRMIRFGDRTRVELLVDVLNALNDTSEEGLQTDVRSSPNFGRGTVFVDPRRAMVGVRLNLGR